MGKAPPPEQKLQIVHVTARFAALVGGHYRLKEFYWKLHANSLTLNPW